jgi:glycogen phosphorylase
LETIAGRWRAAAKRDSLNITASRQGRHHNSEDIPSAGARLVHQAQTPGDRQAVDLRIIDHLTRSVGALPERASTGDVLRAVSLLAREHLAERWVGSQRIESGARARRIYYLSMEFLIGRTLGNALQALGLQEAVADVVAREGRQLADVLEQEPDAALGNGGLGRLAACFLDSMATLELPSWGYGMRYEFGMFAQAIHEGRQVEAPDSWLDDGTPWEFPRPEVSYEVHFGGWVERNDGEAVHWRPHDELRAKAFDMVIPGHGTDRVATLRLWKAAAPAHLDLEAFNRGDYARAAEFKSRFESISWVLYPNDSTAAGRELRLRQEYFFVSASLQDIVARHLAEHATLDNLADHIAIHLNDTHPAIAVAELMRLLLDAHGWAWAKAWAQCRRVFSYTNHTLMPEALESWPVALVQHLLPRHFEIILHVNHDLLEHAARIAPGDLGLLNRLSIIDESGERRVRMAHLCIAGSHCVNGVSKLHSDLMRRTIFADFARLFPERFDNKTNGVTPRRWLAHANPPLSALLDRSIGPGWRLDLDQLSGLAPLAQDAAFRRDFDLAKRRNKERLAAHLAASLGIAVDPDALFDVQVKRIHEYKRQLLNVLHLVARYHEILAHPQRDWVPRCAIFAGKAASAYHMAKLIIQLIHDVARTINGDARLRGLLKVAFVPNYGVSVAELIMPAADLSEQISTAGTEASGTGNMKLALNGALTIGTEDGANIELRDAVGADHIFIFGHSAAQVAQRRADGYDPRAHYEENPALRRTLDEIAQGRFCREQPDRYRGLVDSLLLYGDHYLLLADYAAYVQAQQRVDALRRDGVGWSRTAIANVAAMGPFSSDRTVRQYASQIWDVQAIAR